VVTVKHGDCLEEKANRPEYAGFVVDEISPAGGYVRFINNVELKEGESKGADREAIFEAQIRYTVEEHFRRQLRLRPYGIKVLSLFFIDRVDNYAQEDGIIRQQFARAFNELKKDHPEWSGISPDEVQAAYFAERRRRGGIVEMLDSVTGESKADEAAYDLIMKNKERLLSFEEPVAFIFSHSALREGWDNPNVFQICTLNQTASEVKKRQEVGRGVRLAVDQNGDRMHDERVNVLTVVANESYERYVQTLQTEIEEEYGREGLPPRPADARKRGTARLRKECLLKPEFKELWERIKHKTRYVVKIDTERFLADVVPDVDEMEVRPHRVTVTKAQVQVGAENTFQALQMSAAKTVVGLAGRYPLPNLIAIMENLMERTTPPIRLTRRTMLEVFRRTSKKQAALENPHEFALGAVRIIKERLAEHLIDGIRYEKNGQWYEMSQLEGDEDIESWMEYLVPAERAIYDHVVFESKVERAFVEGLEKRDDVKLYFKLPSWFTVKTPVGDYNPDWAIVIEERDEHGQPTKKPLLYLVRETKAEDWKTDLRLDERRKITCGERHFKDALGVDYRAVSNAGELP
ncbi:MAG: DEAD/DEAH box helicase, partial [bacterium]